MFSIKYTDEFKAWLFGLKDKSSQSADIAKAVKHAATIEE